MHLASLPNEYIGWADEHVEAVRATVASVVQAGQGASDADNAAWHLGYLELAMTEILKDSTPDSMNNEEREARIARVVKSLDGALRARLIKRF